MCQLASASSALPSRVHDYVETIVHTCADDGQGLVSLVVFGSAAIGGWAETISDVDLILVVPDGATELETDHIRAEVERIEMIHRLRSGSAHGQNALERFVDKVTANVRSFFICSRGDLLSGNIGRILGLQPSQALLVDRVVLANIVSSGITVWGEDLLPLVPVAPIRRSDVFKAFFGLSSQALLIVAIYPLIPGGTRYAMGTLKRSIHNCFFCYELRRASLEDEVSFFHRRLGWNRELMELLSLRREYRRSFSFVVLCLPTLVRLHLRTFIDNRFPRQAHCGRLPG
jgi:predicted nucleotidyltransferase